MWLVPRLTDGTRGCTPVPDALEAALVRWYAGRGSDADHRAAVLLVVKAREAQRWLACDCLGPGTPPPLLSPAYLSEAETYYLRRLTSAEQGRPEHHQACPFHLPQAPLRLRETLASGTYELHHPAGLFNAHRLAPEKLAQGPLDDEPDDRSRGVAIPRLARLMWQLLEAAQANVLKRLPAAGTPDHSIRSAFEAIRQGGERFEIAPGVALPRHLYFSAKDVASKRVFARLRAAEPGWPAAYAPQAFLLVEASEIKGQTVRTGLGEIAIRNRIQHAGIHRAGIPGPYLVLLVVGEHSKREGYLPLRGYAQPIFKGNRFVPVHSQHERSFVEEVIDLQFALRRHAVALSAKRFLFDVETVEGSMRPDYVLSASDTRTGEMVEWAVQLITSGEPSYVAIRRHERERMAKLVNVLAIDRDDVASRRLSAELGRHLDVPV